MNYVLDVCNLSVYYGEKRALEEITLALPPRELVGIIGPNGAGKSTFIKAVMGLLPVQQGDIKVWSQPVAGVRKKIAYVPQRSTIDFDFPVSVEDVVMMGRYPHLGWWRPPGARDRRMVAECLEQTGMLELKKRQIGQLSGGQQQRVFLARALAQEADLFFLDEPFAGIDIASENTILQLLQGLRDQGKSLLVVHHDLNKAKQYFDRLILLNNRLIAFGRIEEVFQLQHLRCAYDDRVTTLCGGEALMVVNG